MQRNLVTENKMSVCLGMGEERDYKETQESWFHRCKHIPTYQIVHYKYVSLTAENV